MKEKIYDVRKKEGQRKYLEAIEIEYHIGFEENEKEQKAFTEGMMYALSVILGIEQTSEYINGKVFKNYDQTRE